MITNYCHILNGDALKLQFPKSLDGDIIVARECLVDGNVQGDTFEELMLTRATFISQYPQCSDEQYYQSSLPEFKKIMSLTQTCHTVCWFEDDLFCQANFWYVAYLLKNYTHVKQLSLVRPNKGNEYSFGNMTESELITAFKSRIAIDSGELTMLANLWPSYQKSDYALLTELANQLHQKFPFLVPVVEAHIARQPDASGLGYPERVLLEIMKAEQELSFSSVFRAFNQKMGLYSFGDLQVKVMYDRLLPLR